MPTPNAYWNSLWDPFGPDPLATWLQLLFHRSLWSLLVSTPWPRDYSASSIDPFCYPPWPRDYLALSTVSLAHHNTYPSLIRYLPLPASIRVQEARAGLADWRRLGTCVRQEKWKRDGKIDRRDVGLYINKIKNTYYLNIIVSIQGFRGGFRGFRGFGGFRWLRRAEHGISGDGFAKNI